MASREKKPLAPSKAKQKANNDCDLPSNEIKSRKGKALMNIKQQQFARDILEAVATGSQLPSKLEASVPRKKVLRSLKRKQKLRVAKANLIKSKVTRKVGNRNLCRITTEIKKGVRARRAKLSDENSVKQSDISSKIIENHVNSIEGDSIGTEGTNRSAKNNLRAKKTKFVSKSSEETENKETQGREIDTHTGFTIKSSPKLGRKSRTLESFDSLSRSVKSTKFTGLKKNSIKDKDIYIKTEGDIKCAKGRKSSKDIEYNNTRASAVTKFTKSLHDSKSSIDLTIDEVIASMLSDSEIDNHPGSTEKIEGKVTRSKKMLVEENIISGIEVKREVDIEDVKNISDEENLEVESIQSAIQLRKRSNPSISQRSLRNGKLRQSDSGMSTDLDLKKRRRLNSDDPISSEITIETITDGNLDLDSNFLESTGNDSHTLVLSAKDDICLKEETLKSSESSSQTISEIENNNNGDQADKVGEVGPTLRSKTKAKSTEVEIKSDNIKTEYTRIVHKCMDIQEELKKTSNLDQVRKDNILAKFSDKSKGRRSSLNIDMKKTVNSFYCTEKSDGNPKSQIDQMIENIKLTIAKSIESKIFGPEKGLGLNKNFEVPKIEEIIAPLSAETQKLGLDENADEDRSTISKSDIKSDSTENSVPKVADTAKEIEKLVMGDIELTETHSPNVQESESPDTDASCNVHNVSEIVNITENSGNDSKSVEPQAERIETPNSIVDSQNNVEEGTDEQLKCLEDGKRSAFTRMSFIITDKASLDKNQTAEIVHCANKLVEKSTKCEDSMENASKFVSEGSSLNIESSEVESTKKLSTSQSLPAKTMIPSGQVEEKGNEEEKVNIDDNPQSELKVYANMHPESNDVETVESISKEVEKLITEDQPSVQLQSSTKEVGNRHELNPKNATQSSSSLEKCSTVKDSNKQVTNFIQINQSDKSNVPGKAELTNIAKEELEKSEANLSQVVENVKKIQNNYQALVTSTNVSNTQLTSDLAFDDSSIFSDEMQKDIGDRKEHYKNADNNNVANNNMKKKTTMNNNTEYTESVVPKEENESENMMEGQKYVNDDRNKRVLRAREKTKKLEKAQTSSNKECSAKIKTEEEIQKADNCYNTEDTQDLLEKLPDHSAVNTEDVHKNVELDITELDRHARSRRAREIKKRKEDQLSNIKNKRPKRDIRKSDQQNKEETLLDNEVAEINENNHSFMEKYRNETECTTNFRGFSEGGRGSLEERHDNTDNVRSKSENDLIIHKMPLKVTHENRLSRNLSENHMSKQTENIDILNTECKAVKTHELSQKDSDEVSTSGESSSSVNITPKILETPEDKAKKESILRLLGLESLEKAAERLSHQKAKKEQYTGTLKTVIRVQKEKEKDKRRSRSPLKMVLKQGRGDGEGDSPENFYTIQKEFGTSGWGDSSSGANRKFSTNHRHSCDEDNEDAVPKDRQSLVIPEKSSSFSIHPGRLCADVCCYCFGKFGSLDTPMHLAQMKSDERRKKILNIERHLTKDSCLCDACYRHVDRKANTSPTNLQTKPQKQHRQLMVSKCSARDCRDAARHHVKRRWLLKIKVGLQKQVDIDWESSQHTSMSFCVAHYSKIERFLTCALCKRRLARNHTHQLASAETDELNQLLGQQRIPVLLAAGTFVCKLCRYFTQLQLKYKDVENMNTNHRSFFKSYRKRILHYHDIEVLENEDDDSSQNQPKDKDKDKDKDKEKDKRKKTKCTVQHKTSKILDGTTNSVLEKSTTDANKTEGGATSETDNENCVSKTNSNSNDGNVASDVQFFGIESTVEKLKKRKLLDMHLFNVTSDTTFSCDNSNEVVEILAMDKEVTLTRLPKRPRTNNDITPVVQRLGANPSISVRTLFPGEEEMNLHANIEFTNVREITPQGWEKCATMIQYDRDTKLLWQELQRPYGNQSSFLRHLILLEKYYRSGDLVLAPNASRNAINYSTSVQNRLISYEGPEKMDEPIMEPIASEYHNSRRLSGGYVLERDKHSLPGTSTPKSVSMASQTAKGSPPRVLKLNPGVSIIKKPPPNLQRLNFSSTSTTASNGNVKRKDGQQKLPITSGGKVFQLSEPDFKRLQNLKKQKQQMVTEKQSTISIGGLTNTSPSPPHLKPTQYHKAQIAAHTQFQKHLRMQQEMLNRQSRSDFEPLICDVRALANENSPTQNLLHNLNLPKSIQVTTKTSGQIPILPKIPKSLTVIPQTVTRPSDK